MLFYGKIIKKSKRGVFMYFADNNRYSKMQYSNSGKSGLKLPKISLGLWHNFGTDAHFDLANNYGPIPGSAEANFGKILKNELNAYRDELVVSTKAGYLMWDGPYGDFGSRKHLLSSLDQSLKRLGLEYVDIFYHHRMDQNTPLEESMSALNQAVKSGTAIYAGISNYDRKTTKKAMKILKDLNCPFIINQVKYSMFNRTIETDNLPSFAKQEGVGIIAFSPLAQGLLTDRYLKGIPNDSRIKTDGRFLNEKLLTKERLKQIEKLNKLAGKRGQTLAQMALSWVLKDDAITSVLIGASKPSQVVDNVMAVENCKFTKSEISKIDEITLT